MHIILKILFLLLIIIFVVLVVLFLFCIIPLSYILNLSFKDKIFDLKFKFCIFKFELKIKLGTPLKYRAQIMHKIIADSDVKNSEKKEKSVSIGDTDFIKNKNLESSATIEKTATREILKRAEEYNKELNAGKNAENKKLFDIISFIDSFSNILPEKIIYPAKLITKQWCKYYKNLLPKKVVTNTEFGIDDPYSVGLILGAISPLYAMYGRDIKVTPHFDKNVLKSDVKIIGRPQIIFIIIPIVNLLLDKKFREIFFKGKNTKRNID